MAYDPLEDEPGGSRWGRPPLFAVVLIGAVTLWAVGRYLVPDREAASPPRAPIAAAGAPTDLGCLSVAPAIVEAIQSTLTVDGGGSLRNAKAVRSGAHRSAYFISADIDGPGLEGDGPIGTWFSPRIDSVSMILSVPATATAFSQLGDASTTDAAATRTDPGARESIECVRRATPSP